MTVTMLIREMYHNPYNAERHAPTDPDALYMWSISRADSTWTTSSGIEYKELKPLLDFWNLQRPGQLVGRTFETPDTHSDPSSALDLLIVTAKNRGVYTFPTSDQLYERAIAALALMRCPDFSDEDGNTVYQAFATVFSGFTPDENWFIGFCQRVTQRSGGTVLIVQADPDSFSFRVKGPGVYLNLVRGNERKRLFFGPYSSPFQFDELNKREVASQQ